MRPIDREPGILTRLRILLDGWLRDRRGRSSDRPAGTRPQGRPAVFLDRDGTLIEDVHYLVDPRRVRLLPGAAKALRRLRDAGFVCVVVTNQSAIARGMLTEEGLRLIHEELNRQLAARGAALDAIYHCPAAPASDPAAIAHPDRKPAPGMLLRAAADLGLDLGASWMIGDALSDARAGRNAGCRGSILVQTGRAPHEVRHHDVPDFPICRDLLEATRWILARSAPAPSRSGAPHTGAGRLRGHSRPPAAPTPLP